MKTSEFQRDTPAVVVPFVRNSVTNNCETYL